MRLNNCYALCTLATVALAGCSDASGPALCTDPVTVTFAASPTPSFSWAPNCQVDHVLVETPLPPSVGLGAEVSWQIAARVGGEGIAAPLRYGVAPLFMEELVPADPLQPSRFYLVRIYANDVMVGQLSFQYWPPD
jgi:hypothetical protein